MLPDNSGSIGGIRQQFPERETAGRCIVFNLIDPPIHLAGIAPGSTESWRNSFGHLHPHGDGSLRSGRNRRVLARRTPVDGIRKSDDQGSKISGGHARLNLSGTRSAASRESAREAASLLERAHTSDAQNAGQDHSQRVGAKHRRRGHVGRQLAGGLRPRPRPSEVELEFGAVV